MFLVSWRNATAAEGGLTWDDYVADGVLAAIDGALAITGATQVNTLGFCVGGTLLASALAVRAAADEHPAASMTLLTTMLDFSDTGEIGLSDQRRGDRQARGGHREGRHSEGQRARSGLRVATGERPDLAVRREGVPAGAGAAAFDLLYWNSDDTNLPGPMYCWYVRNTYLENKLRDAGRAPCSAAFRSTWARSTSPPSLRLARGPHRALEVGVRQHRDPAWRRAVRARCQRPHRRGHQPAGQEEAQLLGRAHHRIGRGRMARISRSPSRAAGGRTGPSGSQRSQANRSRRRSRRATTHSPPSRAPRAAT